MKMINKKNNWFAIIKAVALSKGGKFLIAFLFIVAGLIVFLCRHQIWPSKEDNCAAYKEVAKEWKLLFEDKDKQYREMTIALLEIRKMSNPGQSPVSFNEIHSNPILFAVMDTIHKPFVTQQQKVWLYADSVLKQHRKKDSVLKAREQIINKTKL